MLHRLGVVALLLGLICALALGACGSNDSQESGAKLTPPPVRSGPSEPATTAAVTTTAPTTPATATTPTTTTSTTPTTPSSSSGGATTTQPSGGAPAGCPSVVGGFIRDLHGSDCGVARTVATAWFDAVHGGAAPDGAVEAAGYRCNGTLAGERASVTCDGGSGAVTFTASP
ncbi:MAG TPA: hypothetical protein VFG31_07765 [Conexibacter sp.]|nr:hypothetical protein [Conexibacter sp.]